MALQGTVWAKDCWCLGKWLRVSPEHRLCRGREQDLLMCTRLNSFQEEKYSVNKEKHSRFSSKKKIKKLKTDGWFRTTGPEAVRKMNWRDSSQELEWNPCQWPSDSANKRQEGKRPVEAKINVFFNVEKAPLSHFNLPATLHFQQLDEWPMKSDINQIKCLYWEKCCLIETS